MNRTDGHPMTPQEQEKAAKGTAVSRRETATPCRGFGPPAAIRNPRPSRGAFFVSGGVPGAWTREVRGSRHPERRREAPEPGDPLQVA